MINVSNRSVSCRKITEKGDKSFCRGNFSLCSAENPFLARAAMPAKKCQRICLQSFKAVPFSYRKFFSKRRSLNDDGQTFFFPEVFPGFMACPHDSMAIQLLAAKKGGHLSLSPRRGPVHDRNFVVRIGRKTVFQVAYIKSSCDVISRDLFLCDSSRFSVERINDKIQFLSKKKNQTSTPFLPICEK